MSQPSSSASNAQTLPGFLPMTVVMTDESARSFFTFSDMMVEVDRLRTLGTASTLTFALPPISDRDVLIRFDVAAFVWRDELPRQNVEIRLGDVSVGKWSFTNGAASRRAIAIRREDISSSRLVRLTFLTPNCARPRDLTINDDGRFLAIGISRITWEFAPNYERSDAQARRYGRTVGHEARKSYDDKLDSGFWNRYITGPNVLDIGFRGYDDDVVPIVENAIGVDLDYPGYDGTRLPFDDESQDAVFSSHCLEHIPNHLQVIQDWFRVTKLGGHIITVVPNAMLYERKVRPPSRMAGWNHQRFYTAGKLLSEFESVLVPNTYRIRHLAENDTNYRYDYPTDRHPDGCYEIELVIEKIRPPDWSLDE